MVFSRTSNSDCYQWQKMMWNVQYCRWETENYCVQAVKSNHMTLLNFPFLQTANLYTLQCRWYSCQQTDSRSIPLLVPALSLLWKVPTNWQQWRRLELHQANIRFSQDFHQCSVLRWLQQHGMEAMSSRSKSSLATAGQCWPHHLQHWPHSHADLEGWRSCYVPVMSIGPGRQARPFLCLVILCLVLIDLFDLSLVHLILNCFVFFFCYVTLVCIMYACYETLWTVSVLGSHTCTCYWKALLILEESLFQHKNKLETSAVKFKQKFI